MNDSEVPLIRVRQPRTWGEFFQACAYGAVGSWAVVFWLYPPTAFVAALDASTRVFWCLAVLTGALTGVIGLITRLDLKVELPGVLFMLLGPLAYATSQVYYVVYPPVVPANAAIPRTQDRYALIIYASIPIFFLLVRLVQLLNQARTAKRARQASSRAARQLIEIGVTEMTTGPVTIVTTAHVNSVGTVKRPAHEVMRDAENFLHPGGEE